MAVLIKYQAASTTLADTHLPLTYPTLLSACPSQPSQSESSPLRTLWASLRSPWQPAEALAGKDDWSEKAM